MESQQPPIAPSAPPPRRPLEEGYLEMPTEHDSQPRLIASYSEEAKTWFFPQRLRCPITEGEVTPRPLSPVGELYAWTYVHFASMGRVKYADQSGYGVAQVDFPEGPRVQGVLLGDRSKWKIGSKMRVMLNPVMKDEDGADLCSFAFEPVDGGVQ